MRLGPYELFSEVGRGSMGVVYRGRSVDGRIVAVKVLEVVDPERLALFARERRLLEVLGEREGFVPLLDAGGPPAARRPYLIMPFVGGGTLRDRLRSGPLPVEETVLLGATLAAALGVAHERGIVHRDLKPENVLFTTKGEPLLADFGLAKHFDRGTAGGSISHSLSQTGDVTGTIAYMAPEQLRNSKTAGPAADVFALGAILYECLTGVPAFAGRTIVDVAQKVGRGHVSPIARPGVPRELEAVVRRALEPEPRGRYATGASLASALRGLASSAPQKQKAKQKPKHDRPSRGIARAVVAGGAGGGLLLLVALRLLTGGGAPSAAPAASNVARAASSTPPAPPRKSPAADLLEEAARRLKANDGAGALPLCERALELDPKSGAAYAERARARFATGDIEGAIRDDDQAIAIEPDLAPAWNNRGAARSTKGDWTGTIADETRAILLDPKLLAAWATRAAARLQVGDAKGALEDCTHAIELDPKNASSWLSRAAVRAMNDDIGGALSDCTRAIEVAPRDAAAWRSRATVRAQEKDVPGAIADFERFLELAPDDPHADDARRRLESLRHVR